jgi:hypothetical protein
MVTPARIAVEYVYSAKLKIEVSSRRECDTKFVLSVRITSRSGHAGLVDKTPSFGSLKLPSRTIPASFLLDSNHEQIGISV